MAEGLPLAVYCYFASQENAPFYRTRKSIIAVRKQSEMWLTAPSNCTCFDPCIIKFEQFVQTCSERKTYVCVGLKILWASITLQNEVKMLKILNNNGFFENALHNIVFR